MIRINLTKDIFFENQKTADENILNTSNFSRTKKNMMRFIQHHLRCYISHTEVWKIMRFLSCVITFVFALLRQMQERWRHGSDAHSQSQVFPFWETFKKNKLLCSLLHLSCSLLFFSLLWTSGPWSIKHFKPMSSTMSLQREHCCWHKPSSGWLLFHARTAFQIWTIPRGTKIAAALKNSQEL